MFHKVSSLPEDLNLVIKLDTSTYQKKQRIGYLLQILEQKMVLYYCHLRYNKLEEEQARKETFMPLASLIYDIMPPLCNPENNINEHNFFIQMI